MLYKKSSKSPSTVIVICIEMKWVLLDTESTTIITISKLTDSGSLTTKSMLIVSYFVSGISSGQSLLRSRYNASLVYKQRLQVLTYWLYYLDI